MYHQHLLLKLRKPIWKYTLNKYHVHWLSSFKYLKLSISIKIHVTTWKIVYIYEGCSKNTRTDAAIFFHRLSNRAGITAHNTATYMQLIGYNILDVSRLRALQLSSRQRYIVQTGPFYIAF